MRRGVRGLSAGVLAAAVGLTGLAGCSDGAPAAGPPEVSPTSPSASGSASAGPSSDAAPTATAPSGPAAPPAPGLTVPAKRAGDLDADTVPAAPALGRGWARYVDPGDPAEGYLGNGSWVRARGADEVVRAIVPLGCRDLSAPPELPVPQHALEATYRGPGGAPGVALALDYRTPEQAAALLAGVGRIARSCPAPAGRVGPDDPLVVVVRPVQVSATTVLDRRQELGAGATPWLWSEVVVRRGRRVGLLIMATDPAAPRPALDVLAGRLRDSLAR